jgi:hypothetical protein
MSFYLKYTFAKGYSPEKVPECDAGARALARMLVVTAKHTNILAVPLVWILSKFYTKKLTKEYVEYTWFLIPSSTSSPSRQ